MAKSTEITALDDGIVTKSNYRGNVQAIPVTITGADNGTYDCSAVLPQEARVVLADIQYANLGDTFTVTIGHNDDTDALGTSGEVSAAGGIIYPTTGTSAGSVNAGGKTLQVVVSGATQTADIAGVFLIATNE